MKEDKFNGISPIKIVLWSLTIVGIWFIYKEWLRRKKVKKKLIPLIPLLEQALSEYDNLINNEFYFAHSDEQNYLISQSSKKESIPEEYFSVGLNPNDVNTIDRFVSIFETISEERKKYNDQFVKFEKEKYADFFKKVAEYPLSEDQIDAVIRDEDNNLVIAGAGTGKTTTISAKVAYLLKKGLARPDELLIIAFTRNAVNEMFNRTTNFCEKFLGNETLEVRTFNSFGFMVTRNAVKTHFGLAFDGDDDKAKSFLQSTFDELFLNDENFRNKAVNFIAFFNRPARDEFTFKTGDEYMKHESNFKNTTLDGVNVKSKEEMEIGNFLYLFKVNYSYEHPFPLKPEDIDYNRGQYRPDFYLPDYQIWHEHYGINENGDVPNWFSYSPPFTNARDSYHSTMNWKNDIHSRYNTRLVTTFSYENKKQKLISSLKKQLIDFGVELQKREPSEMLDVIHKSDHYEDFMNLIYTFLNLMKSNNKRITDFKESKFDKRLMVFLDVFKPLYQSYQSKLTLEGNIDYNDMINEATEHISQGNYNKRYKYILVDEFQDMSLGRYDLLMSLKKANPGLKLYGVGDDWQSIFRFSGSDISITTEFEKNFGFTHKASILQTYRFNKEILGITSSFIQQNPSQLQKELTSTFDAFGPSFSFIGLEYGLERGDDRKVLKTNKIDEILTEIENLHPGNTVFLIGRYHHNSPFQFEELKKSHPLIKLDFFTAHGVKGLTCDYAILLDVDSGKLGFPSEIADDPILNYLLFEGDDFDNAEERRVFYVAMSRARNGNYFLFDKNYPSKFLLEIFAGGNVENPFADAIVCPKCKGRMIKRVGPRNEFYGCSNYPRCNGIVNVV